MNELKWECEKIWLSLHRHTPLITTLICLKILFWNLIHHSVIPNSFCQIFTNNKSILTGFNRLGLKKDPRLTKKFVFSNTNSLKLKMKSISSRTDVLCQTCIETLFHSDFKLKSYLMVWKKGQLFPDTVGCSGVDGLEWIHWSRQACASCENFHIISIHACYYVCSKECFMSG